MRRGARCRACGGTALETFCDLGMSPLANSYVDADSPEAMERFFPLHALVCGDCLLVQLEALTSAEEIFSDYAYFSSWSTSWVEHARRFADDAVGRFGLGPESLVVELASNDGYLLRWFRDRGVPVLGIEPAANVAVAAVELGVPTVVEFFGTELGRRLAREQRADLIVANNVLAHVPDLHDFVGGIAALLAPGGRATLEFPHLRRLVEEVQFDTIYHEHFSYFSLLALLPVLAEHGLAAFDVEELTTHGGSLRLHVGALDDHPVSDAVTTVLHDERRSGLDDLATYRRFGPATAARKRAILRFLFDQVDEHGPLAGYGAPAKANTLLNYCGIGTDLIQLTVDANPVKQGTLLPGSRIPVLAPTAIPERRPGLVVLMPWNLRDELAEQLRDVTTWGGRLAVLQPTPEVLP